MATVSWVVFKHHKKSDNTEYETRTRKQNKLVFRGLRFRHIS